MTSPIGTPSHINESTKIEEDFAKDPTAKVVRSSWDREYPADVSFERLVYFHDRTPQLQIAVSSYKELITGTDIILNSEDENAVKELNEWMRKSNFKEKFDSLVSTILICGNGMLEKLNGNDTQDVAEVDMTSILNKKRNEYGELEYYEQKSDRGMPNKLGENNLGAFIEFNLTAYTRQAWGKSLFHSLATPRMVGNRSMMPMVEALWTMEDAMVGIYANNAYPITTITYPNANDTVLKKETQFWNRYKPGDKRVGKIKPEIEFFEAQGSQSKYTEIIEHIEKAFELGTQFPHDIMTGDFTSRASSETTENIVMKRVRGYQHYLANKLKQELFDSILIQKGFDVEKVDLDVSFTAQNIVELEVTQVKELEAQGVMTKKEAREWLRKNTGLELPDDDEIEAKQNMAAQVAKQAEEIKKESIKMKAEVSNTKAKPKRTCKMCKEGQHAFCSKRGCQCQ